MHGMINSGLESFIISIYGPQVWSSVRDRSGLSFQKFETMLYYDDQLTEKILSAVGKVKSVSRAALLEDFGTFIVSEHSSPTVLKLLRLGGETYEEFLYSLEDLNDRVGLVVPDFDLPILQLEVISNREFRVHYKSAKIGYGAIFLGILRAMADSYNSLVFVTHIANIRDGLSIDQFAIEILDATMTLEPTQPHAVI